MCVRACVCVCVCVCVCPSIDLLIYNDIVLCLLIYISVWHPVIENISLHSLRSTSENISPLSSPQSHLHLTYPECNHRSQTTQESESWESHASSILVTCMATRYESLFAILSLLHSTPNRLMEEQGRCSLLRVVDNGQYLLIDECY